MTDTFFKNIPSAKRLIMGELRKHANRFNESVQPIRNAQGQLTGTKPSIRFDAYGAIFSPDPQLQAFIIYRIKSTRSDEAHETLCYMCLRATLYFIELCMCVRNMYRVELLYKWSDLQNPDRAEAKRLFDELAAVDKNVSDVDDAERRRVNTAAAAIGYTHTLDYLPPPPADDILVQVVVAADPLPSTVDDQVYALSIDSEMENYNKCFSTFRESLDSIRRGPPSASFVLKPRVFTIRDDGTIDFSLGLNPYTIIGQVDTYINKYSRNDQFNHRIILNNKFPELEVKDDLAQGLVDEAIYRKERLGEAISYYIVVTPMSQQEDPKRPKPSGQGGGYITRKHVKHRRSKKNIT